MSEQNHNPENEQNIPPAQEEAKAEGITTPEQAVELITALEAERNDLKDKLLRTLADMENLRRRTAKEISDARVYSTTNFAKDMLTVADNIRRALDAMPKETLEAADAAVKGLVEGVELTERDLLNTLDRHGVKKLDPMNQKFDPNFHQAMFEIPDATVPSGTVLQVVQTGYAIGDRVLRPAMVGVAKGGPKAPANEENGTDHSAS